jgi:amino acid adenylation domain-containing protein
VFDADYILNKKINFQDDINESYAKFDLTLRVIESGDDLLFSFNYASSLFCNETIKHLINLYKNIITIISENKDKKIKEISFLDDKEKDFLVNELNNTYKDINPDNKTVIDLFQKSVENNPDSIALVFKGEKYTYNKLNVMVNKLANYIIDKKLESIFVPLVLDRSSYMIISILAIIKTGCAYVPIDPNYPVNRIEHILNDIASDILVVDNNNYEYINKVIIKSNKSLADIINVENLFEDNLLMNMDSNNLNISISLDDPVYVIYTSGSTGKPKGVVIKHMSLYNYMQWMKNEYDITSRDKILQKTNYTFDVSLWEIILPLLINATLVIADVGGEKDSNYLINLINKESITIIHFVPSMLIVFLQTLKIYKEKNNLDEPLNTLKYIFVGGESLNLNILNELKQILKNTEIHNRYGPTEATINVTSFDCNKDNLETIPIGKPIINTTCYILDNNQKLLPFGSVGELYVGGAGLAKEYLNDEKLTNRKFILNPYQTNEQKHLNINDKLYKTGDLVRLNKDNDLEYLGRKDFQVKIRGYRIELGEIENILLSINEIEQAVLIVNDNDQLIAYYQSNEKINENKIRNSLVESLPEYMIPDYIQYLDKLPLNNSDKVDRAKLPEITIDKNDTYQKPTTELELNLLNIWSETLKIDKNLISINDNFFQLGGNSLLSIILSNKISKKFNKQINIVSIFKNLSIKKQELLLINNEEIINKYQAVVEYQKGNKNKKRIIFVHPGGGGAEAYNQFAKLLNKDIPFYVIDNYNLKNINNKIGTIKDIAKVYVNHIKNAGLINDNNFILGGWSFGGIIAFEMTSQLEKMNKKPEQLLLFDSSLNVGMEVDDEKFYSNIKFKNFSREFISMIIENSKYLRKITKEYIPTPITTDCIYYYANIKNTSINKKELNGFKIYLKNFKEISLNISHSDMFLDEKTLKNIIKSLKKIE